ncbi:uncharacterized protein [Porites lutea]
MKLQSFLFSLLVLSMFYSQCLSASSCKMANWWGTFDHQGWSTCDSSAEYIKGLWRNHNYGDHEISLLEEAKCCSAPTPEENTPSICQDTDWSSVLDGIHVWAVCPDGYFLQGLWRDEGKGLVSQIDKARCCKLNTIIDEYDNCYNENIWGSFDHYGLSECKKDGYYVAGIYKSNCDKIYCIEELKCCSMLVGC